jgi:7-cyano-7-deazaguanine synthase
MDSTTALWMAIKDPQVTVRTVVSVEYGQQGALYEVGAARMLVNYLRFNERLTAPIKHYTVTVHGLKAYSGLSAGETDRDAVHPKTEIPITYFPSRNLTLLSIAASFAFDINAGYIVGGWVAPDVPYPDCRPEFLKAAQTAINYGLGAGEEGISWREPVEILAPVLNMAKSEVVKVGSELDVPWKLTRSCYKSTEYPCLECDSCVKRMAAFADNGMPDPLVSPEDWQGFVDAYEKGEISV